MEKTNQPNAQALLSGFKECALPNPRCSTSCDRQRNAQSRPTLLIHAIAHLRDLFWAIAINTKAIANVPTANYGFKTIIFATERKVQGYLCQELPSFCKNPFRFQ